jgi:uncharacterized protein (TIGR02996 family)
MARTRLRATAKPARKPKAKPAPAFQAPASWPLASELLTLWRETHEPRVADVLEAIARTVPVRGLPSSKRADIKRWFAWMAKRTAADVPEVIAAIDAASPTLDRIAMLDRWEPDPRIGRFVLELIGRFRGFSSGTKEQALHVHLFGLLAKHADTALVDRFDELARIRFGDTGYVLSTDWFDTESAKLVERLRASVPRSTGDRALHGRCDAWIAATRPKPVGTRAELYGAVYAAPDDDGVRAVLADVLQADGDPHGELIALQLAQAAGRSTPVIDKRVNAVLRKCGAKLAPQLVARVLGAKSIQFERGFPSAGYVYARSAKDFKNAIGATEWATVHSLCLGGFAGFGSGSAKRAQMLEFVTHPAMRHLRRVGPMGSAEAIAIVEHAVPVPWTDLGVDVGRSDERELVDTLSGAARIFSKLQRLVLAISPTGLAALTARARWLERIEIISTEEALGGLYGIRFR